MPAALAVDWDQIKQAAIAGVPFPDLALQWEMLDANGKPDTGAIRQRCKRESWPIPRAILASASLRLQEAKAAQNAAQEAMRASGQAVTVVTGPTASLSIADSLRQNGEKASLRASQIAANSLDAAPDSLPVQNPADLKTLLSVARIAAGMDKAQPEVKVNLAMFQAGAQSGTMPEGVAWEVETSGESDET